MAQSAMAKSPIGVTLYWDKGPQPNIVWDKWFETAKLAITAKENIQVEKLLRPNPQNRELDYSHETMYELPTSDERAAEKRQREQRNIKRKFDWQNQCLAVGDKGPNVDKIPWDEADTKKSLIYLSLGQEAANIFHQRNPHREMSKWTTDAFVEQLRGKIQRSKKRNIRPLPILQLQTRTQRITGKIPLKNKAKSSTLQLGRLRRQTSEKHIHSRHAKHTNRNRLIIRRPRHDRNTTTSPRKRKRPRKSTKNGQPRQIATRHKPTRTNRGSIYKTQQHTTKTKHTTKNGLTTDTKIRSNTRLLEMWKQVHPRPPQQLPSKE